MMHWNAIYGNNNITAIMLYFTVFEYVCFLVRKIIRKNLQLT